MTSHLIPIAHRAMSQSEFPILRFQRNGKFVMREGLAMTLQDIPGPAFNFAAALREMPPPERIFELAREFFPGPAGSYGILVEADSGHPMEAALKAKSWKVIEDEPALVLPVLPDSFDIPAVLRIECVSGEAGALEFRKTAAEGFGAPLDMMDTFMPGWKFSLHPFIKLFIGYVGDRPVTCAMMMKVDEIATVHGVGTVPEFRRKGYGRAITWAAVLAGAQMGCTCAALRAADLSFVMYKGMGFVHVCNHRTYAET